MKETCRWQSRPIRLPPDRRRRAPRDRKSTRLNSSHLVISYAVFCLKKKNAQHARKLFIYRRQTFFCIEDEKQKIAVATRLLLCSAVMPGRFRFTTGNNAAGDLHAY